MKLELVHSDVCGPQRTLSLNESRYFVLFIDDYSRFTHVYFMKHKSEVVEVFWKFKAMVEKQSGCSIKTLRTDNGTEYTSEKFEAFCTQEGINHQLTVVYSPQQNGVSERKNRTVMEMARCMLFEKNLPKKFWAEAVNTAVYLQNRTITKSVKGMTPFEAWYGSKPSLDHIRIFGCICYVMIPSVKRDKLDRKSTVCIFLGYCRNSKGYRVYDPKTNKLGTHRNVAFDEEASWKWKEEENEEKEVGFDQTDSEIGPDIDHTPVKGTRTLSDIYERCNAAILEPTDYVEALKNDKWRQAMQEEINMINKHQTWELVPKPRDQKVIGVKWIFRTKLNPDGSVNKLKARLVVKGYAQKYGVDYSETFAPVARHDTIRFLLAFAAQKQWRIFQLDVKSAFLNGKLKEKIYVEQPDGFEAKGKEGHVYLLSKALYGLKQAPRAWYDRIDEHFSKNGFKRSVSEPTLYVKFVKNDLILVSVYVDDLLVTGSNSKLVGELKKSDDEAI